MHGFNSDPFASTNSEHEELLENYFVPPPYFKSVLGDPVDPKTRFVFAPRGGGKTAQRRMIEVECLDEELPFVCITYDQFDVSSGAELSSTDHLRALCRLLTVAILEYLDRDTNQAEDLNEHQKRVVKVAAETFAGSLTISEYHDAFTAVKSLGERAKEFWHRHGGVIAAAITIALKKAGLDDINIPAQLRSQAETFEGSGSYFYNELVEIITEPLRGGSIYILVDKVDETPATNLDPGAAWSLIKNLALDLPTLEKKNVGFKFFLWDSLRAEFLSAGGRGDRMQFVTLEGWDPSALGEMLSRRLKTYSDHKIPHFDRLMDPGSAHSGQDLLVRLAHGSPREMIRMGEAVAGEHTRIDAAKHSITDDELYAGIRKYSALRSEELYGPELTTLRSLGRSSFTLKQLKSDLGYQSAAHARSVLEVWLTKGLVTVIGETVNKNGKHKRLYGVTDARVLLAMKEYKPMCSLLNEELFICDACGYTVVLGAERGACTHCHASLVQEDLVSLDSSARAAKRRNATHPV